MDPKALVKKIGYELGFDLVSVSAADPVEDHRVEYESWKARGFAAGLKYMVREEPRRWVPQDLLPEARSVITFACNFFSGEPRLPARPGFGRVARYAWGKDYHEVIHARLVQWQSIMERELGRPFFSRILVDSGPLLERAFAYRAGTGFIGKNTLLISRSFGSFIFLAEVLTSLELKPDSMQEISAGEKDACGSCRLCIDKCPTGAFPEPRVLDAGKCISYWTIENKDGIPSEMRPKIGDWIFGCDLCQEVCPYQGLSKPTRWGEFAPEMGAGAYLSILEVLAMSTDEEFKRRFPGSPVLRAKRSGLLRNACVVAGNQRFAESRPLLEKICAEDPSSMVREHAEWALGQF